ncbi:MAG: hypothetical protein K0R88_1930 [Solirubrobacterales bacterium]|nr:hypothetical protein [Solirubrobacterales bacterium]
MNRITPNPAGTEVDYAFVTRTDASPARFAFGDLVVDSRYR